MLSGRIKQPLLILLMKPNSPICFSFIGPCTSCFGSLAEQRTAEYRIANNEFRRMESLREIFFKIGRIHSFDVRCLMFVSFFFDQTGRVGGQRLG
jgi:hypothetical protein